MPSLLLFGRRWAIGSDDFVFPPLIDLTLKGLWFIASSVILIRNYELFQCDRNKYSFLVFLGLLQICMILNAVLAYCSSKGGIMENEKRKKVPKILYLRIFAEALFISWNILMSSWHYSSRMDCLENEEVLEFTFGVITFNWILLVFQLIFLLYAYDILGASNRKYAPLENNEFDGSKAQAYLELPKTQYTRQWHKRLHLLTCRCCDKSDPVDCRYSVGELSRFLGNGFVGEDLVHTDVVAGIILLGIKHRREKRVRKTMKHEWREWNHGNQIQILKEPKAFGSVRERDGDWRSFKLLSHFLKYASAIFGWKIIPLQKENSCLELAKLITSAKCLPCTKHPVEVEGDNCCFLETAGVKATLGAEYEDIIYVSFQNQLFEVPFFVALDHVTQSVVLSCRGSMSINDALLDFTGFPTHIEGYPSTFKAHRGMLTASQRIKNKLDRLNILPMLFASNPTYSLVLTGHSLGAGCASMLSLMYLKEYPTLKCYSYSPPGGVLSYPAAEFCNEFVTSITYGDDIIIRCGIFQIERFRLKLIEVLKESRIPKYRLLMRTFPYCKRREDFSHLNFKPNKTLAKFEREEENGNVLPSISKDFTISIVAPSDNSVPNDKETNNQAPPGTKYPFMEGMYPPGKIIYVKQLARPQLRKHSTPEPGQKWMWRWADRTEFDDIIVSRRMFFDHFPIILPKSLKYLEKFYS